MLSVITFSYISIFYRVRFIWPLKEDIAIIEAATILTKIGIPVLCPFSTPRQCIFRFPGDDIINVNYAVNSFK
jgi:hypothetical protein